VGANGSTGGKEAYTVPLEKRKSQQLSKSLWESSPFRALAHLGSLDKGPLPETREKPQLKKKDRNCNKSDVVKLTKRTPYEAIVNESDIARWGKKWIGGVRKGEGTTRVLER